MAAAVTEAAGTPPPQAPVPAWAFRSPAPESWAAAPSPLRGSVPPGAVASVAIPPGLHDVSLPDPIPISCPPSGVRQLPLPTLLRACTRGLPRFTPIDSDLSPTLSRERQYSPVSSMVTPVMSRLAAEVAARSVQPSPAKSPGEAASPAPSVERAKLREALRAAVEKREEALHACQDLEGNLQYMGRTVQSAILARREMQRRLHNSLEQLRDLKETSGATVTRQQTEIGELRRRVGELEEAVGAARAERAGASVAMGRASQENVERMRSWVASVNLEKEELERDLVKANGIIAGLEKELNHICSEMMSSFAPFPDGADPSSTPRAAEEKEGGDGAGAGAGAVAEAGAEDCLTPSVFDISAV